MPFNQKPQKFNAKINDVTIGSGDKTVTFGGDCTFPFYSFDPYQRSLHRFSGCSLTLRQKSKMGMYNPHQMSQSYLRFRL